MRKIKKDAIITALKEYAEKRKMSEFSTRPGTLEEISTTAELLEERTAPKPD